MKHVHKFRAIWIYIKNKNNKNKSLLNNGELFTEKKGLLGDFLFLN